ncbi:MAG: right-handed parallel beta-helix repeat-containing protein [Chitinivibrionales bacterium]|nr:right-handed parallel beta-helix repeat-containing protein [Chitinivibrionales bacterium]
MFNTEDPLVIWVSPQQKKTSTGIPGSYENPYDSIHGALLSVNPGQKIVLKPGVYKGDISFEISGSISHPIRIAAQEKHAAIIAEASWFFYDCSDLIVSGLAFQDAPLNALSVIGRCRRNRFEELRFLNCGTQAKTTCALFFGGSGVRCNVVEECVFDRSQKTGAAIRKDGTVENPSIGLMISEGRMAGADQPQQSAPNQDQVFRKNSFVNYDYAILAGSLDSTDYENSTLVEYNTIAGCRNGIVVKNGDTSVNGNIITACSGTAIAILAGRGSQVAHNRILDCATGIAARGKAHTIVNNCLVRCRREALYVLAKSPEGVCAAQNLMIEENSFVDWGESAAVRLEGGSTSIVRRNLFAGPGQAVNAVDLRQSAANNLLITGNAIGGACLPQAGCAVQPFEFASVADDDFENNSPFGAHGPVCSGRPFDPDQIPAAAEAETAAEPVAGGETDPCSEEEVNQMFDEKEAADPPELSLLFPEDDVEPFEDDEGAEEAEESE